MQWGYPSGIPVKIVMTSLFQNINLEYLKAIMNQWSWNMESELMKLTKEQQLTVKRLFDRFKNNLSDKSYLKFRKRVHKAIGFNGEYDMRVLTIDEVNLTFGIETDGYGHT
jgi:hypothetical protein